MNPDIKLYNEKQLADDLAICDLLAHTINAALPQAESKVWHAHPVWFINENPIVGYSKQKKGIRLMFWSGADFQEPSLNVLGGKFIDASIFYNSVAEINLTDLSSWLQKAQEIQWDYKNIVKRKGILVRL